MTWCDAISDALIAQASRFDLKHGAANLNVVTVIAFGLGGIFACASAGLIELDDGQDVDPNFYFGAYAALIVGLLIAAIFLNSENEPEIIRMSDEERERLHAEEEDSMGNTCSTTFGSIGNLLSYS